MNRVPGRRTSGGGYAAADPQAPRRLRARPSGLKGRCAIAAATGLRPALDPEDLCGPWAAQDAGQASKAGLPRHRPRGAAPSPRLRLTPACGHATLKPPATARKNYPVAGHTDHGETEPPRNPGRSRS